MQKVANFLIKKHGIYDSFYIADMKCLSRKIEEWCTLLPRVEPFYAIKCNPNVEVLKMMISRGFGFDCASRNEIDLVKSLGGNKIVFAHPVKKVDELRYAASQGIKYTTFDSKSELDKMSQHARDIGSIIRLRVNNPSARVQLGLKYGVTPEEYKDVLKYARNLGVNIIGASFHVGSASSDASVFSHGVDFCKDVFDYGRSLGYDMNLVDVGGGFTAKNFRECAKVLSEALDKQFSKDVRIIAEPGRYFVEEMFTFFTPVIGVRERDFKKEYWIGDSLYGSFNCVIYDKQEPKLEVLRSPLLDAYEGPNAVEDCKVFLQTCDSVDGLGEKKLPPLRIGDFLMVENFGAYTIAGACNFNGFNMMHPKIFYI